MKGMIDKLFCWPLKYMQITSTRTADSVGLTLIYQEMPILPSHKLDVPLYLNSLLLRSS